MHHATALQRKLGQIALIALATSLTACGGGGGGGGSSPSGSTAVTDPSNSSPVPTNPSNSSPAPTNPSNSGPVPTDPSNSSPVASDAGSCSTAPTDTSSSGPVSADAPSITSWTTAQYVTAGQPATLTVAASGASPMSYQWQRNGVDIAGATTACYKLNSTRSTDDGSIWTVRISNAKGSVTTAPNRLNVLAASTGSISIVASSKSGAKNYMSSIPSYLAADAAGNIYGMTTDNSAVQLRKLAANGVITTLTLPALPYRWPTPFSIAVDGAGNVYTAMNTADPTPFPAGSVLLESIYRISPAGDFSVLTTDAGYGALSNKGASFSNSYWLSSDPAGTLYVGTGYTDIYKVTGGGQISAFLTKQPRALAGLTVDTSGNIWTASAFTASLRTAASCTTCVIMKTDKDSKITTDYAGKYGVPGSDDGPVSSATFTLPQGLTADSKGNIYVLDNRSIRKISTTTGMVSTIVSNPNGTDPSEGPLSASIGRPSSIASDGSNLYLVTQDSSKAWMILKLKLDN